MNGMRMDELNRKVSGWMAAAELSQCFRRYRLIA